MSKQTNKKKWTNFELKFTHRSLELNKSETVHTHLPTEALSHLSVVSFWSDNRFGLTNTICFQLPKAATPGCLCEKAEKGASLSVTAYSCHPGNGSFPV